MAEKLVYTEGGDLDKMFVPENQVKVRVFKEMDKNKKKDDSLQDKDKIEQAASIIQGMLINSEFVQFTKNENLDKKNGKSYDMRIVNDEILKKLDNKEKLSLADLNKLKKVYYQPEDYEFEFALHEINKEIKSQKDKFTVNDMIYGIVMLRRDLLREELENKMNKVKEEVFINLDEVNDNMDPELQGFGDMFDGNKILEDDKPEIVKKEDVESVIKVLKDNTKVFKKEIESARKSHPQLFPKIETNFKKFNSKKAQEKKVLLNKLIKDNKIEEDEKIKEDDKKEEVIPNKNKQKVSEEINKIKKEKNETNKEFFNSTARTRYELARSMSNMVSNLVKNNSTGLGYWADIIRTIENDPNKKGIAQNEQNLYSMLDKIQKGITQYTDIAGPLNEAFNIFKSEASKTDYKGTDLFKLNLLNIIVALVNKIDELTKIVNAIW